MSFSLEEIFNKITNDNLQDIHIKVDRLEAKLDLVIANSSKEWFTNEEAMHYLSIVEKSIKKLRDEKILPFSYPDGKYRYKKADLDKYLNNSYTGKRMITIKSVGNKRWYDKIFVCVVLILLLWFIVQKFIFKL